MAIVDVVDRPEELLKKLNEEFAGRQILYVKSDIGELSDLEAAFKRITETFDGQLDVVINTAGVFNDLDVNKTLTVNAVLNL